MRLLAKAALCMGFESKHLKKMGYIAKERPILEMGEWQCASLLRQLSGVRIQTLKNCAKLQRSGQHPPVR